MSYHTHLRTNEFSPWTNRKIFISILFHLPYFYLIKILITWSCKMEDSDDGKESWRKYDKRNIQSDIWPYALDID